MHTYGSRWTVRVHVFLLDTARFDSIVASTSEATLVNIGK